MSNYLVNQEPNRYNGQQNIWLIQSDAVVQDTVDHWCQAKAEGKDLVQLFHDTLSSLAQARANIAADARSENASDFGTRRDEKEGFRSALSITGLNHVYKTYNPPLLSRLQDYLRTMPHMLRHFTQSTQDFIEEPCQGRQSTTKIQIFFGETIAAWSYAFTEDNYRRLCALLELPVAEPVQVKHLSELFTVILTDWNLMRQLQEIDPNLYQKIKRTQVIKDTYISYPQEKKSDWILATSYLEINDRIVPLSEYLTWRYRDGHNDPVERRVNFPIVTIIHQDPFFIPWMLSDIAQIFQKAMEWDQQNLQELIEDVALLQYEIAHAMPFLRGSAAIAEWLEQAMYRYHGFAFAYVSEKLVNLEALTLPLALFIRTYPSMIHLTPKNCSLTTNL